MKGKLFNPKIFLPILIIVLAILAFGLYQMNKLQVAHSSFENYYRFRGCVSLIEKVDTYGICKLASGQTIKLVNVNNKWFLDGDLGW